MKTIEIELTPEMVELLPRFRESFPGKTDEEVITAAIKAGIECVKKTQRVSEQRMHEGGTPVQIVYEGGERVQCRTVGEVKLVGDRVQYNGVGYETPFGDYVNHRDQEEHVIFSFKRNTDEK